MKQESTQATSVNALNRAKMYQLVLFPMNNGATNVYYILTMNFIAYYANGVLGLLLAFATTMVTLMRAGDAFCPFFCDVRTVNRKNGTENTYPTIIIGRYRPL